jgi:hypothetical protein
MLKKYLNSNLNQEGKNYNELKKEIYSLEGEHLLEKEAQKHLDGKYSLLDEPYNKENFMLRFFFKDIYKHAYKKGFKDGFLEGGLAMEIEITNKK